MRNKKPAQCAGFFRAVAMSAAFQARNLGTLLTELFAGVRTRINGAERLSADAK